MKPVWALCRPVAVIHVDTIMGSRHAGWVGASLENRLHERHNSFDSGLMLHVGSCFQNR